MDHNRRRMTYTFLCAVPFLAFALGAARPLRVSGLYQSIGVLHFSAICLAAWKLGGRAIRTEKRDRQQLALAGVLLLAPFALVSLLWVGLGAPWVATAAENQMRYLVLIVMAMVAVGGFVVLKEALAEAGERYYSTLGFAAIMLAGSLYVIWDAFVFGAYFAQEHGGEIPQAIASLRPFQSLLLSLAGALTYFATAALAASLARIQWLGHKASLAYIIINVIALSFIVILVMQHPDPATVDQPWYNIPGSVLVVPALPLIMPFLLGVVVLRRAGDESA